MKNKKLILGLVVSIILVLVIGLGVWFLFFNKKEKINVYLFWGDGCPHCENAKQFFSSIKEEYSEYYNLVEYEVWYNDDNSSLLDTVKNEFNLERVGVPFIVIGDEYFKGYSSRSDEKIKSTIVSQYENDDYVDIVEKVK